MQYLVHGDSLGEEGLGIEPQDEAPVVRLRQKQLPPHLHPTTHTCAGVITSKTSHNC